MDIITTIQNLLTCNGCAAPVMVALTPNEISLIAAAPSMHAELTARRARDAEVVRRQDMTTNDKLADALRNLIRAGKHLRNTVVETRGVAGMDDHDVAISDSIAALAEHDAQPAPEL